MRSVKRRKRYGKIVTIMESGDFLLTFRVVLGRAELYRMILMLSMKDTNSILWGQLFEILRCVFQRSPSSSLNEQNIRPISSIIPRLFWTLWIEKGGREREEKKKCRGSNEKHYIYWGGGGEYWQIHFLLWKYPGCARSSFWYGSCTVLWLGSRGRKMSCLHSLRSGFWYLM